MKETTDPADRFLATKATEEGLTYPQYKKKYGFGHDPHNETAVGSIGDSQVPVPPAPSGGTPEFPEGDTDPIDPETAKRALEFLREVDSDL